MRILCTNDDGIHAPGLKVVEDIAGMLLEDGRFSQLQGIAVGNYSDHNEDYERHGESSGNCALSRPSHSSLQSKRTQGDVLQ